VLSVATLRAAASTTADDLTVAGTSSVVGDSVASSPDKEATLDDVEITGSRAPIALRIPISRVRSATDTNIIFIIPIAPTSSDTAAIAISNNFK
jgi:hypothetical protein